MFRIRAKSFVLAVVITALTLPILNAGDCSCYYGASDATCGVDDTGTGCVKHGDICGYLCACTVGVQGCGVCVENTKVGYCR